MDAVKAGEVAVEEAYAGAVLDGESSQLGIVLVEQFGRAGDVGDTDFHPDADHPLPEARRLLLLDQARPCELIDDLTQTDVVLSAQALRRSDDLGIESYRFVLTTSSQHHRFMNHASLMRPMAQEDLD